MNFLTRPIRSIFLSFSLVFNIVILSFAQIKIPPREKININREWKFILGDQQNAAQPGYVDTAWKNINLPHSFSTPYFGTGQWYTGYGWYRKYFDVGYAWKDKRIFIEFEGAFRDAELFVNGKPVGHHQSGYTGFSYDVTDAVRQGKNVLAVRLNNLWNPQLAPRDGDHNFCGGIYRDAYLVVTNTAHVTWYGTFVTTPVLSRASGTVNVQTEVANQSNSTKIYVLKTSVIDPGGKIVDSFSSSMKIGAGTTANFNQTGQPIPNPKLWHPQHPYLYKTVSQLYAGELLVDTYETPFGFRSVEWTADKGFFLNGEHYYFHGANVHQDHAGWASAVTNTGFMRDVNLVRGAGFDFIRGSHYPHDPAFYDACDSLGVMMWSENDFWAAGNFTKEGSWYDRSGAYPIHTEDQKPFEESVRTSLREMIRVNRNHPSVVIWSMCNEVFFSETSTKPRVKEFLKELADYSHQLDPTRKVAIGGSQRGGIDKQGDVAGYNGDGARIYINPGIPNVVSEYGSTLADRPGRYIPGFGDVQGTPLDWRSGQVLWCAFDYGTHFGDGKFGHMGMIDYFRLPKRMWYWYRNEYLHIPPPEWPVEGIPAALSLTADKKTISNTDGTDDVQLIVTVLDKSGKAVSNSPDVTLTLESGPGEFPTGNIINFSATSDIAIRAGQAAIEFRSYYGGTSRVRASSPGLKDAFITIETKGLPAFIPGKTQVNAYVPYIKYGDYKNFSPTVSKSNIIFQKPTRASSEAKGHTAGMADDEDVATYWAAMPNAIENWWQVDMESLTSITRVNLYFANDTDFGYKMQVSFDGLQWTDIYTAPASHQTDRKRAITISKAPEARFLRIIFIDVPLDKQAVLNEVEVFGKSQ
ncbi:F5/8 type C domain-containing protein [Mucilaginibacter gracilis]|uniref:F5/8 type C domain-containing protein n=1 Tax=Mucilaginibacter gracilis TaxID=423350 RepID=A0A495IVW7_9SPHI|nr:glycoside hydrolase family 2 TIM barrel-domain containing protein [Mucilaginibacter gracilis]RKR80138.1 F5/8 type C domain-containing protein [Mucilaginibacter gracilis]